MSEQTNRKPFPRVQLQDGKSWQWTCPYCGGDCLFCPCTLAAIQARNDRSMASAEYPNKAGTGAETSHGTGFKASIDLSAGETPIPQEPMRADWLERIARRLKEHDKGSRNPSDDLFAWESVAYLLAGVSAVRAENTRLRAALEDIADPEKAIHDQAAREDRVVDRVGLAALLRDADWFREKARAALRTPGDTE